jgi:hypothetical protein
MTHEPETEVWRTKDGRAWRIGADAEIAWIQESTEGGLAITSAIPPVFEAYATLELPGSGDHDPQSWLEDGDRHAAGVLDAVPRLGVRVDRGRPRAGGTLAR